MGQRRRDANLSGCGRPHKIIGDDVELFVDANGGYGREQAIWVMQAASDFGGFEEPVSSDDLPASCPEFCRRGRRRLRRRAAIR